MLQFLDIFRNIGGINNPKLYEVALSSTKNVIHEYIDEVMPEQLTHILISYLQSKFTCLFDTQRFRLSTVLRLYGICLIAIIQTFQSKEGIPHRNLNYWFFIWLS